MNFIENFGSNKSERKTVVKGGKTQDKTNDSMSGSDINYNKTHKTDFSKKEECKLKRKVCLKRKNLPDEPDITCDIQEECSNYSDKGTCNKQEKCEWRK